MDKFAVSSLLESVKEPATPTKLTSLHWCHANWFQLEEKQKHFISRYQLLQDN